MKILIAHNRYVYAGGEDVVVQAERELLESYGHNVLIWEVNNDSIIGIQGKVKAALSVVYSSTSREQIKEKISHFRPDIVHVHNFFPLLSPAVYDACRDANIPVVQTLHNYRLACPKAMPLRDGKICEDCIGKVVPWSGVAHGCYRGSRVQSAAVATMLTFHTFRGTWQNRVDAYIALTNFHKDKMVQAGLPRDKIHVKPNFVLPPKFKSETHKLKNYALFVGRLSEEKGVSTLIDAYAQGHLSIPLKIVGDGPLDEALRQQVQTRGLGEVITFLGRQTKATVLELMYNAKFLIFPSIWYEGFPLTIAEAFACSLPVIAAKLGSMAEIVEDGVTGLHFEVRNPLDLAAKINWAITHPEAIDTMEINARCTYEAKYTPEANYKQLMEIYNQVMNQAQTKSENVL
ncbi:glycosyltransferase [Brasilonema bromeliae]|uniref:Glycosyltransferase family 1 protein n=1 Tax=Brasilonema bromeliae SPC951 TaxID=385972 RepID=A0ABX1P7L0_9CYAN|nr:glycosyltransferase [Brasilonema bromeliae]NMG20018.1 glycosyltransferase family 1 protein [Brasilonema bromeliae SPC951]